MTAEAEATTPFLLTLLLSFGPAILIVALFVWLMRRSSAAATNALGLGKSRARKYEGSGQRVTFDDVAGIDEAKAELTEIVDFLKEPDRFRRLGGAHPAGRAADRARPAPARPCSPARSPVRRACRSSR